MYVLDDSFDFSWLFGESKEDVDIKVLIPDGLIMAVSKSDPSDIVWQHKVKMMVSHFILP